MAKSRTSNKTKSKKLSWDIYFGGASSTARLEQIEVRTLSEVQWGCSLKTRTPAIRLEMVV